MTEICKECQNIATMKVSQRSNYAGEIEWMVNLCPAHFRDVPYLKGRHYLAEMIETE